MTSIVIGNSASYGSATNNAAGVAASLGSQFASASSGALTIKNGVKIDNSNASDPKFRFSDGTAKGMTSGSNVTTNTQGPLTIDSSGVFGASVTIASGVYLWSDSTSSPALKINVPCTVTNSGYIIGKGGVGGYRADNAGDGGPALEIASGVTGVTIVNNSGAYIAGGGGGGAGSPNHSGHECGNGGGGAGGGRGGGYLSSRNGGAGGAIGSSGANGQTRVSSRDRGRGGGAGGGAGHGLNDGSGGGGGGRILPGTGGAGATNGTYGTGGSGGSGGNAGGNALSNAAGGGGGGWGAAGGYADNSNNWGGGSGGAAIKDNGVTYTLTNNGTVYGTT